MKKRCLIITEEISNLAKDLGIEDFRVKNLVALWQEQNNKGLEEYPTSMELKSYLDSKNQVLKPFVTKIISGGQTGVDTIGLLVGESLGIETGGTAPKGFLRERNVDSIDISQYGLVEITDEQQEDYTKRKGKKDPYTGRTELNVRNSDGTVYFSTSDDNLGYIATKRAANEFNKPFINNPTVEQLKEWIIKNNIKVLNIAGNRGSKLKNPQDIGNILYQALNSNPESLEDSNQVTTLKQVTTIEIENVDRVYTPQQRRDRVNLITSLFSEVVSDLLEEATENLNNRINNSTNESEIAELNRELRNLSRQSIITEYKPSGIFSTVLSYFQEYLDSTYEDKIQEELEELSNLSEEESNSIAKKNVEYKVNEYKKLIDNFTALAEEAGLNLLVSEGIIVYPNTETYQEDITMTIDNEDFEENESKNGQEERIKEGWMTNFRQVSNYSTLTKKVRKVLSTIPKLGYNGKVERDDLGYLRYLDSSYTHAVLLDILKDMIDSTDMLPLLEKHSESKPWIKAVIKKLESDDILYSQFYSNFRKDFTNYWIQKSKLNKDGSYKFETIPVNRPESTYYLIDAWRDNQQSGTILGTHSVYNNKGELVRENAIANLRVVQRLQETITNLESNERLDTIYKDENFNRLLNLLRNIGIQPDIDLLKKTLSNTNKNGGIKYVDPIINLLGNLNVIYSGLSKTNTKNIDFINTYGTAFNSIALMFSTITDNAIESSFRENDKSYYSHNKPNYVGKMIKLLKNVRGDINKYKEYLEKEFGKYEWFKKNNVWRNSVLEDLEKYEEYRKALDHKVVLNFDKSEYQDWDSLDTTLVLLNEYFSVPDSESSNMRFAWYNLPILADAPSSEFIKLRKYVDGVEYNELGRLMSYKDILVEKFTTLAYQEYDRIQLVRERFNRIKAGENIKPIKNFDITVKGDKINLGGAEFKFLPALNNYTVFLNGKYVSLIDALDYYMNNRELSSFYDNLKYAIKETQASEFDKFFSKIIKLGLLGTNENGSVFKYLPQYSKSISIMKNNISLVEKAKEILSSKGEWTENMESILNSIKDGTISNKEEDDFIEFTLGNNDDVRLQKLAEKYQYDIPIKNALEEYFWNSSYATSQIIQLTTTDLAYYKDIKDFQKRFKEVHAPSNRLNTLAKFNGEVVGKEFERTVYLSDSFIESTAFFSIEKSIESNKSLSKIDRDFILTQFRNINVADAQAYRSPESFRTVTIMSGGEWNSSTERAFNNIKNGNWNIEDFNVIWQTIKPFVYTQIPKNNGIDGKIKVPVQHKNSEFMLLASYSLIANSLNKSPKLKAIQDFMSKHNIDVVQFESTTKVGLQGNIDLNKVNTYTETTNALNKAVFNEDGNFNEDVLHEIPYEDYGIQTENPEHIIDHVQLIGTQIRKLISADISDDAVINVGKKSLTKKEWLNLYNAINTENIIESFKEIQETFNNPKEIEKLLHDEIRKNPIYGLEMLKATTINEDGLFNIPLFDPVITQKVQTLLNSVIKSRVTKQRIKGGTATQVSNFGLTDELNIVFKTKDGENLSKAEFFKKNKNATEKDYKEYIEKELESGGLSIAYFECYMPAYSRDFYESLMKDGTLELDISKLDENLRRAVGYRIPTEDKYSMIPLRIKGFLPQQNGSAIMLPSDITTISGSDFDIDKLYIMLPEYRKIIYDMRKAIEDFKQISAISNSLLNRLSLNSDVDIEEINDNDFKKWFKENKDNYKLDKPKFKKIQYDFNKSPQENSREARNNLIIDMMYGVLTNEDTTNKILTPGGGNYQKKAGYILDLLKRVEENELRELLKIGKDDSIISNLEKLNPDELKALVSKFEVSINPLSPSTFVYFHGLNSNSGKMIGIYANHNANHAIIQHTNLELSRHGSFTLFGKTLTSLHNMKNDRGEFISNNNAGFLGLAVDDVKEPTLGKLNQNVLTADVTMLLSRLGYNPIEIGILLNQPLILDMTRTYFRKIKSGFTKEDALNEAIEKYKKYTDISIEITFDDFGNKDFSLEELSKNIINYNKGVFNLSEKDRLEFFRSQVSIGALMQRVFKTSDALGSLVQATKADSNNGASGPTIADSLNKLSKLEDYNKSMRNRKPIFNNGIILRNGLEFENIDELRSKLLESPTPYIQAFHTLGLESSIKLLNRYFPYLRADFAQAVRSIRFKTKSKRLDTKTINSIYNDLLVYALSKEDFFKSNSSERDKSKRHRMVYTFPEYFNHLIGTDSKIAELGLIKRLRVIKPFKGSALPQIIFKNVGTLTPVLKEGYMRDWATLANMDNPDANELAHLLFLYSFFRNGFSFGPNSFIHLAPVSVRKSIPNYINSLYKLLNNMDDFEKFTNQYIYNHLDNRKIVPMIPTESTNKFVDDNGNPLDTVRFMVTGSYNTKANNKAIRDISPDGEYDFFDFIAFKSNNGVVQYYKANSPSTVTNLGYMEYKRINPLGIKNEFLEYEYGVDAEDIITAMPYVEIEEENTIEKSIRNEDIIEENSIENSDEYSNSVDIFNLITQSKYGEKIEEDSNNLTPNDDFKDDENKPICK